MENNKKTSLEQYQDPSGDFSNQSLKLASWYIKNKETLKKILIGFLIFFDTIFMIWGLFGIGKYLFYDSIITDKILNSMTSDELSVTKIREVYSPNDLVFKDNKIFLGANKKYDLATKIFNPNERWLATVNYRFVFNGGKTEDKTEIILPNQERYFIFYGLEANSQPNNFKIEIINIKWQRINEHKINDITSFVSQRINFSTENLKASRAVDTKNIFLQFIIVNNSIFAYKQTQFNILFFSDNNLVAVSPIYTNNFLAGERKKIELTSLSDVDKIDEVKIETIINIFDKTVFLDY
ncbi:MAG: hypothetical protein WC414_03955 [Patescibacteria group bacterium]